MSLSDNTCKEYFLNPGELIFSKKPVVIKTVLGSCVAVCLYDRVTQCGGMCHYLLPEAGKDNLSTKYGNVAIRTLIRKFQEAGSLTDNMEAAVIGGAFIIFDEREIFFIGDRNADTATSLLKENRIRIKITNTGGDKGKRVVFHTGANRINVEIINEVKIENLYGK